MADILLLKPKIGLILTIEPLQLCRLPLESGLKLLGVFKDVPMGTEIVTYKIWFVQNITSIM